jgi:hypothetical protein
MFIGCESSSLNSSFTLLMVNSELAIAAVSMSDDVRKVTVYD